MKKNGFMAVLAASAVLLSSWWSGIRVSGKVDDNPPRNATYQRDTLSGLRAVRVVVERLEPEVEEHGLLAGLLQADTERQLIRAGIDILAEEERLQAPGTPYLYVSVNVSLGEDTPMAAVGIDVALKQSVVLARDPVVVCLAPTWRTSSTGRVGHGRLVDIRGVVKELVAEFTNDYHAANPAVP